MAQVKTNPDARTFLLNLRNSIDHIVGEANHWKRVAMSRTDVIPCDKCVFLTEDCHESNVFFCGNEECPCSYKTIEHPHDFYCKMAIAKEEEK